MLSKWIAHELCSSRLESRSRALRSEVKALEANQKELVKRLPRESKQLQRDLEGLEARREAELQEAVAFLNRHLASCQDMVQALQKYTEQAYAAVEAWLRSQVHWGMYNSAKQRIKLLEEQSVFLRKVEKAYRVLYDAPQRREWCTAQPESAFTVNCHVQACADALKRRRKAIGESNRTINATLKRIGSQLKWISTELQKARSDRSAACSEAKARSSTHQKQRDIMKEARCHAIELWKELKSQIDARHPDGLFSLQEEFLELREQHNQLRVEFREFREAFVLAKETVNRAFEEEDFDDLESKKDARDRAFQEHQNAFEEMRACGDQIGEVKSILEDREFYALRQHWDRLNPYEHMESINTHFDGFLQNAERRRWAIGGPTNCPPSPHRPNGRAHG